MSSNEPTERGSATATPAMIGAGVARLRETRDNIDEESSVAEVYRVMSAVAWQPIETAPKDGRFIVAYCPSGADEPYAVLFWGDDDADDFDPEHWWFQSEADSQPYWHRPTRWLPLPESNPE